ncbi:MAG: lipoprotein insertase outer membrane protein LolB [Panacagrimonas sp.]
MSAVRLMLVAMSCLIGACATHRPNPSQTPADIGARWQAHQAQLAAVKAFRLDARMAGGLLGFRAKLRWQQFADAQFRMRVSGPLGSGATELSGDPQAVTVRHAKGEAFTADPESWIRTHYGWQLPINGLRDWALGRPQSGIAHHLELDESGRAGRIVQSGWQLEYLEYQTVAGISLPRRINASNGQTQLRLVADQWDQLCCPNAP